MVRYRLVLYGLVGEDLDPMRGQDIRLVQDAQKSQTMSLLTPRSCCRRATSGCVA